MTLQDINTSHNHNEDGSDEERKLHVDGAVQAIGAKLAKQADDLVGRRATLEQRWYIDDRQLHGRYEEIIENRLKKNKKSRLFVKETGPKAKVWTAKLTDLLFPTDDKNWGMKATPVPELIQAVDDEPAEDEVVDAAEVANRNIELGQRPEDQADKLTEMNELIDRGQAARDFNKTAMRKAKLMERECDDQMTQGLYNVEARAVIKDAVDYGTGILKGPYDSGRRKKIWVEDKVLEEDENGKKVEVSIWEQVDEEVGMPTPSFSRVDFWAFFPDDNALTIEDAEFTFERHLLTKKDLRAWAKREGFDKDAIRRVIRDGKRESAPNYIGQLRAIKENDQTSVEDKYVCWEYRGPLEHDDIKMLFENSGDLDGQAFADDIDPLEEVDAIVYVVDGEVIKFGINPFDNEESIYSVYNFMPSNVSIWGWGVPWAMRDSQNALNSAWRMMMDNGTLSVGPQIIVDKTKVTPADGDWALTARKIWLKSSTSLTDRISPFELVFIDSNQTELANIVSMARDFMETETNLPSIVTGDISAAAKTTFGGTAILQTNANIIFKLSVRQFDDDITTTILRRLFHWNMQFNPKNEIKGDFEIDARGSSVLLVREIQSQNLIIMLDRYSANPVLSKFMKIPETFRAAVSSMLLDPDLIVKSDDEVKQDEQAEQEAIKQQQEAEALANQPGTDPQQTRLEIAQLEIEGRIQIEEMKRETALIKLAEESGMKVEELRVKLGMQQAQIDHQERSQAGEAAVKKELNDQKIAAGDTSNLAVGTRFE